MGWITRRQGWLFFPLLLLEGINLHVTSIRSLFERRPVSGRVLELTTIALRIGLYVAVVFWVLPLGMAFAFLGVQLAVFGVYMGASFAPNHKGMPIVPADAKMDFLSKQVLTSRNITGRWTTPLMGGLNHQVEHHLFPSMARPHLGRARDIVREHCKSLDIPYTETTLVDSYGIVVRYLNRVGSPRGTRSTARRRASAPPLTSSRRGGATPLRRLRARALQGLELPLVDDDAAAGVGRAHQLLDPLAAEPRGLDLFEDEAQRDRGCSHSELRPRARRRRDATRA